MGAYTAAHVDPQGAGDARPTALQIIRDQDLEGKLVGKTIVITGASSGIGVETARALYATGAALFLAVRDMEKARKVLHDILDNKRTSLVQIDTASFASIKTAVTDILKKSHGHINILVNNAGMFGLEELTLTEDGYEIHFATNHLGYFLLFQLLKPALLASSTPDFNSRVINVSSCAHRVRGLNESDNYNFEKGGYHYAPAYSHSKLANVYMANELDRRYGDKGIHGLSLHPGAINTDFSRNMGPEFKEQLLKNERLVKVMKSCEQGAATTVVAAVGREWEGRGGIYLDNCEEAKRGKDDGEMFSPGYVSHTYDAQDEARLWKDSLKMVGMEDDV